MPEENQATSRAAAARAKSKADEAPAPEAAPLPPKRIRLVRPHGFIEEDTGRHRYWRAGEVVKDAAEIALLRGRGALVEEIDG